MFDSGLNLLVVDDEAQIRLLLAQVLATRGHHVRAASDGFAALQLIRESVPDVLLSDLNMPGMTGFELLSVVRRLYPQIHVIATSGAYSGRSVPAGIAADGFHEKATGMGALFELIPTGPADGQATVRPQRAPVPLWISLEPMAPVSDPHIIVNCPQCLRPFRKVVIEIDANIRETPCIYCGGRVSYALASKELARRPTSRADIGHRRPPSATAASCQL